MKNAYKLVFGAFALMLATGALAAGFGKTELVSVDLTKRATAVSWTWTELADTSVRVTVKTNGDDFDLTGWGGSLFVGDGSLAGAVGGEVRGFNELVFDVTKGFIPTNGTYAVQVVATNAAGRAEEWVRGKVVVRANPAAEGMPASWSAYGVLAEKVAAYLPPFMPSIYTNVAAGVVSNVVTKGYVEGLAISCITPIDVVLTNGTLKTREGTSVTAGAVGARADSWMPTAAQVGALSTDSRISDFPADIEVYDNYVASGKLVYDKAVRKGTDQYIASAAVSGGNQSLALFMGDGSEVDFTPSIDETDPTVSAWAKYPTKPTYTAAEVGARPDTWMPTAAQVGAVATNAYWTVKKGSEDGIGVRAGASGIGSTFFIGSNSFGTIDRGGHFQYSSGGYEDFFNGSVLRMLTGSQLWWLTGAKPWLQTATDLHIGGSAYGGGTQLPTYIDGRVTSIVPSWARAANPPEGMTANALELTSGEVKTHDGGTTITAANVGAYPNASGVALAGVVNAWEGYWGGTNVTFEVTNYYGNASGTIPRLRIRELRDNTWRTVWDEVDKFEVCETQILAKVAASNATLKTTLENYVDTAVAGKAPAAWGTLTDKGSPNLETNSVWMTSPSTYFAGGTEYQRVAVGNGAIAVLVRNGATAYTSGEEGTFRFQDDGGTNYFGFAKTDSYTLPCRTDGITVSGTLVTLRYDVIMGGTDVPIVYYTPTLQPLAWVQLNNADGTPCAGAPYSVSWYQSGGSYYAAINCGANPSGFFKSETTVAGEVVFETNMKARLDGGIVCTNTATGVNGVIRPTYNGTSVIWNWSAQ